MTNLEQSLYDQVQQLQKQVDVLSVSVSNKKFAGTAAFERFQRKQNVSPSSRLRVEPYRGSNATPSVLPTAGQPGEMLFFQGNLYIAYPEGIWNSFLTTQPFDVSMAGNVDNQTIKSTTTGALSNYIILNNTTGGSLNLTGLEATSPYVVPAGFPILLLNKSAQNVVIKYNTTSTATNRFFTLTGVDVTLAQNQSIRFIYRNDTLHAWQEVN